MLHPQASDACREALNGSQSDLILLGQSSPGLFSIAPADSFLGLPAELGFPAHFHATLHGSLPARLGTVDDESAFELGKRGEEVHRQASHHVIPDGANPLDGYGDTLLSDILEDGQDVEGGSSEPVELHDDQLVTCLELLQQFRELWSVIRFHGAGNLLLEDVGP